MEVTIANMHSLSGWMLVLGAHLCCCTGVESPHGSQQRQGPTTLGLARGAVLYNCHLRCTLSHV